jgi:sialate O-acetylesterase
VTADRRLPALAPTLLYVLLFASGAPADVKLPSVFSDHAVLQRDAAVPVWGWADAGEEVSVTLGKQTKKTTADRAGNWSVKLDPLPAGDALTLTVSGKNTLTVRTC